MLCDIQPESQWCKTARASPSRVSRGLYVWPLGPRLTRSRGFPLDGAALRGGSTGPHLSCGGTSPAVHAGHHCSQGQNWPQAPLAWRAPRRRSFHVAPGGGSGEAGRVPVTVTTRSGRFSRARGAEALGVSEARAGVCGRPVRLDREGTRGTHGLPQECPSGVGEVEVWTLGRHRCCSLKDV